MAAGTLLNLALGVVTGLVDVAVFGPGVTGPITMIASIVFLFPSLAVAVRRLHDIGRSGSWLLISLVPIVGATVPLVFLLTSSNKTANAYDAG